MPKRRNSEFKFFQITVHKKCGYKKVATWKVNAAVLLNYQV